MENDNTIAAISTARGKAALAIIRVSGDKAFELVEKCVKEKDKFRNKENRKLFLNSIIEQKTGLFIDEVTIIKYGKPFSFTGEDMVEIICHGGNNIIKSIIKELNNAGIKNAERGEFSKRAFINEKIDLMKAEAIDALISSENEIQRKIAVISYQGSYINKIKKINIEINEILAEIEASIEFAEEDDIKNIKDKKEKILKIRDNLKREIEKREKIEEVEKGVKIVIAGPANAGKSTLFNGILGYERSITYNEPGTTRDIITEKIIFNSNEITIKDTAGIRTTENEIEKIGIKKSKEEINQAKIILWVSSLDKKLEEEEKEIIEKIDKSKTLIILSKNDITENEEKEKFYKSKKVKYLKVSLLNKKDIEQVILSIEEKINENEDEIELPDFIINNRHKEIALTMLKEINNSIEVWDRNEIAAFYLHNALDSIEELFGKRDKEDIYNHIFSKFCIGK